MDKEKIVIIGRSIYPIQSPRSFRATELAKELARQGHDVTLYGIKVKGFDYNELNVKYNLKVKSIGKLYFARFDRFRKVLKTFFEFPDIELAFKISRILKAEKNVDLLITIAIPFSIHWGTAFVKMKNRKDFPKVWIADCGDPYMGNKNRFRPFYFKYLERLFCRECDYITIPIDEAIKGYYKEFHNKIKIIPQGFNFSEVEIGPYKRNTIPTFVYAGVFYEKIRNPKLFLDYLSALEIDFKFYVFTKNKSYLEEYKNKLGDKLIISDYIPREELLKIMSRADFLVNFQNTSNLHSPSKLIDYALVNRPILTVNTVDIDQSNVNEFLNFNFNNRHIINNLEQFDITNVAKEFLNLIE